MNIKEPIATEQGHWYRTDGSPCYTVTGKNGAERAFTLRDARMTKDAVPSVTTVLKVAANQGLNVWLKTNLMMAAATLPRIEGESADDWIKRVMDDADIQSRNAANLGTAIHSSLEQAYQGVMVSRDPLHVAAAEATMKAISNVFPGEKWKAEKSFAHIMGFGGKVDLHSKRVVIDFKTSAFDESKKVFGYDEHLMQLAAYGRGVCDKEFRAANAYISTTVPGLVVIKEWTAEEVQRGWLMFKSLLQFWKDKNQYEANHAN